jgi:hypothetical protein
MVEVRGFEPLAFSLRTRRRIAASQLKQKNRWILYHCNSTFGDHTLPISSLAMASKLYSFTLSLCIFVSPVGRPWPDWPGLESYRAVDAHTRYRLHQWLRHKHNGKGAYPDEYLYEQLGLVRPARTTSNLPSAKASFVGQDTRELETFHSSLD